MERGDGSFKQATTTRWCEGEQVAVFKRIEANYTSDWCGAATGAIVCGCSVRSASDTCLEPGGSNDASYCSISCASGVAS